MNEQPVKKRHRLLLVLLIASILIATTALTLSHLIFSSEFDRRVKKLSADGYPVSLDDLEERYVLPKGAENAADLYIKAFDAYIDACVKSRCGRESVISYCDYWN